MNIDIVNTQVSEKLKISPRQVAIINKFYWRSVYDHFYTYSKYPVNIENVCVFYPHPGAIKKNIINYIRRIQGIKLSLKFKYGSPKRIVYIGTYKEYIRNLWKIRKECKFTN